jgi:PPOX class probable F420-dependent enzyme
VTPAVAQRSSAAWAISPNPLRYELGPLKLEVIVAGESTLILTDEQSRLFREPNFAVVTTLKVDGMPQTSVVWVDEEDGHPVFNTTSSRAKGRHLRRDSRVSVLVWDREDPYRYIEVEGFAELDEEGAGDHINRLSHKYRGTDFPRMQDRVIVRVTPCRIHDYLDGPPRPRSAAYVNVSSSATS